jgi:hypothetical protein
MVFDEDGPGGGDASAGSEEGVAENAEDPGFEVGVVLEGVEGAEGFGKGLLHEIFGFGWTVGKPVGVIVKRGEERERELLEVCAAVEGGWHDAEYLCGSEVAG